MSTATAVIETTRGAREAGARPSLVRLTAVELRKMVDTRAGFWLQLTVLGLTITIVVLTAVFGQAADHTLRSILSAAVWPAYFLLPIVGILLVTSEWSQRTTLLTFTLVPQRLRVLAAKAAAGTVLAMLTMVVSVALASMATAIASPGVEGTWSVPPALLGQEVAFLVIAMLTGIGFGMMLLSSAPAIVLFFGLPLGLSALGSIHALTGTAIWMDRGRSLEPMPDHVLESTEWARVGTTLALWTLLPLAIGAWRIARNEVD